MSRARTTVVAVIRCSDEESTVDLHGTLQDLMKTYHHLNAAPALLDGEEEPGYPDPPAPPPGRPVRRTAEGDVYLDEEDEILRRGRGR